jgi:HPt (histidine-containing phosphotransfer) domain-containing protein
MKLESLSGFDVEDALHRLRGNRSLYAKLLHDLAARHGRDGERIREAMLAGDFDGARQVAHQLKGVAGNLSASELRAAAAELEQAVVACCGGGDAGERAEAERLLARLDELLADAVRSIDSLSEDAPAAGGASRGEGGNEAELDAALRAELARSLREAIGLGDVAAVERAVTRLPEGSRQRSELQKLVDAYDFAGVERLVAELERAG